MLEFGGEQKEMLQKIIQRKSIKKGQEFQANQGTKNAQGLQVPSQRVGYKKHY